MQQEMALKQGLAPLTAFRKGSRSRGNVHDAAFSFPELVRDDGIEPPTFSV